MPTYLVWPPPPEERMALMDAFQEAGIHVDRNPEGFIVSIGAGQEATWEKIRRRFHLEIGQEEPPAILRT